MSWILYLWKIIKPRQGKRLSGGVYGACTDDVCKTDDEDDDDDNDGDENDDKNDDE